MTTIPASPLSAYEAKRQKQVKDNHVHLKKLGLAGGFLSAMLGDDIK